MSAVRILVTAVGGGSVGESVCKALRCGTRPYELVVTNTTATAMSILPAEQYVTLPAATAPEYWQTLIRAVAAHACDFMVPGSEVELSLISRRRDELAGVRAKPLMNSAEVISLCLDKRRTSEFLSEHGFRTPSIVAADAAASKELPFAFPCIVKPASGSAGSSFTFVAQDRDELAFFVTHLERYGYEPLLQEYVGSAQQEYTVGVLHDPEGALLGTAVMRRDILSGLSKRIAVPNRTPRAELGALLAVSSGISQGEFVRHPAIRDTCEEIAARLGSRGPLNVQGRWDGARFLPFEINPRFSGTAPMRAMAGMNELELLIDWHLGHRRSTERVEPQRGTFTRGLIEHFTPAAD